MRREDTLPWYRQFWPWFIIALPASAVVAGLYTVWIAVQTNDSLVYDKTATGINEAHAQADARADELNLRATIRIDTQSGAVVASLTAPGLYEWPSTLSLRFRHATLAARDLDLKLARAPDDADGRPTWAGHFVALPEGRHYVELAAADWRLRDAWSGAAEIHLGRGID